MTDFEDVYRRYFKDVFLYVKALSGDDAIAEEITSETFFKALRSLNSFKGNCDIRVWLCQIAKNSYFSYLKKRKRFIEEKAFEDIQEPNNFEKKLEQEESALRIHHILHNMPEPYKEVFNLRTFGELSFQQIAKVFDKNANWACVTYHRAKKKIQEQMEDYHE